ncbi:hypothetical protein ACFVVQ_04715 [Paenibacillus chitinolyticus]|uniref:hypothetical protein n=1 Tax=Paenibacillus chitinolyticus TaxID=79263 RepID=UPI0036DA45A0
MYERKVSMPFGWLHITSANPLQLGEEILRSESYSHRFADNRYELNLNAGQEDLEVGSYRSQMAQKGIYLGHHIGEPAQIASRGKEVSLRFRPDAFEVYQKLFWSYAVKLILTVSALNAQALHLKASTLFWKGKAILLIGRGGSGKTTLARFLESIGFEFRGNTHALVKEGHVWAINTWRRLREGNTQQYEMFSIPGFYDAPLEGVFVVDHNTKGEFTARVLDNTASSAFLTYFSAAAGNYDLKEDLTDLHHSLPSFEERIQYLKEEYSLIQQFVGSNPIHYLSADLQDDTCKQNVRNYFTKKEWKL